MGYVHPLHQDMLSKGWPRVDQLLSDRQQEDVDLDFKAKVDASSGAIDKKDRETLAQTLSAFANSMGGLIVFGVDARQLAPDQPDEVVGIKHISDIRKFASDVKANIPNSTMARLEEVTVDYVEDPSHLGDGVLLVSVARSERRPHRSEAAGDKRYYKRSGSNTIQMEHFEIEDAFRRMSVAELKIGEPRHSKGGGVGTTETHYVQFPLINVSNVSARFPYVKVEKLSGATVHQYGNGDLRDSHYPIPAKPRGQHRIFAGGADVVLHPGQEVNVFCLVFHIDRAERLICWDAQHPVQVGQVYHPLSKVRVDIEICVACEHAPLRRQRFVLGETDIEDLVGI